MATPIGNLGDMSFRAVKVLSGIDLVAAEDTRHSRRLFDHYGIRTPMVSLHEHNESGRTAQLLERLRLGESVAVISDAGTPLVSDPGYRLVSSAREAGLRVSPVPGPSAAIAALSVSGLATDRFVFEGFLPAKAALRTTRLEMLASEYRTLVFYESAHRVEASLMAMAQVFGARRRAVVARELTKLHETVHGDELGRLATWVGESPERRKGEIVIVVAGSPVTEVDEVEARLRAMLRVLLRDLPTSRAVQAVCEMSGVHRNRIYRLALAMQRD